MDFGATATTVEKFLSDKENLAPSSSDGEERFVGSAGLELEGYFVDLKAEPDGCILPFREFKPDDDSSEQNFAKEIAGFGIEGRTSPTFVSNSSFLFEDYAEKAANMWIAKQQIAAVRGLSFLCSGNTPFTFDFLQQYPSWITQNPRFLTMLERQNKKPYTVNPYPAELPTLEDEDDQMIPMSSAMYALTAQHSLNIGFNGQLGFGANILFALTPLAAIFSNSRAAGNGVGRWHWNRLQYAMSGMGSEQKLLKFSMGNYFTQRGCLAFSEFIDHCLSRVELIEPDAGLKTSGNVMFPQLRSRASQSWMLSPRISWIGDENSKISLWAEARAIDAQPTVIEGVALDLLMAGNSSYWYYRGLEDVADLIPHSEVEPTTWQIAKNGPYHSDSTVNWNGRNFQAISWVLDQLIPNALEGLERDSLCRTDWAEKLFAVLKRTLEFRCTGSDWIKDQAISYMSKGMNQPLAISTSLMDMAEIQANFTPDFSNPSGLVDLI